MKFFLRQVTRRDQFRYLAANAGGYDGVEILRLESHEDWLWRPVMSGLCQYESIVENRLDLADIDTMNELIDQRAENELRMREAMNKNPPSDIVIPPSR